jgi:hypothetical protein
MFNYENSLDGNEKNSADIKNRIFIMHAIKIPGMKPV